MMNTKIKYTTLFISVLVIGFSCKKIINQKPETVIENNNVVNTVKDLENILNGAYDGLQSGNVLGGNMIFYSDLLSDDADVKTSRLANFGTNEIYNGNTSVQIGALRDMWRDCYSTINRANNVLNIIENNTKLSGPEYESKKDKMKAEAIFIRAIVHYELLRFWSLPYAKATASSDYGIVIRTKPTLSIDSLDSYKKPRSTVEEVYNFVIDELKKADVLFSQNGMVNSVGYGSSMACKAILARIYYYKGDDENAINYAQQIVSTGNYQLKDSTTLLNTYRNQGLTNRNSNESIFEIINTTVDNTSPMQSYYSRAADYFFRIPATTIATVFPDLGDYRRNKLFYVSTVGSSFTYKYDIPTGQIGGSNIIYIRLAEMYLTLAECKANKGDFISALANYNVVRGRAFANYVAETSTDNILAKIQIERRRELYFEGDRYMFIRKNNLPLRGENNYKKYLFKIPQEEIAGNPDIVQN